MRERNGNVFDATIVTLMCNSLTNLQSMGMFGGFILSGYTKERRAFIIDAQMTSPKNFPSENIDLSNVKEGPLSIAVFSGFLKGILELHKNYATLRWQDLITPAIELCRNGFILTKHLKDSLEINHRILTDDYMRSIFIDQKTNKIKRVGTKIVNSKHCDFLEILSRQNSSADIFEGEIGEIIENDLFEVGSLITLNDLQSYKLKIYERELIHLDENYSMLVPDTSAILIPSIIKILSKFQFNSTWYEDDEKLILLHHRITEVFKHVFAMRTRLGDNDYVNVDKISNYILSDEFIEKISRIIDDENVKDHIEDYKVNAVVPDTYGTSHISIVDKNGDAVSVTSSINF